MKLLAAATLLTLTATPVLAQTAPAAPAAPAAAAPAAGAAAPAAATKFSLDTPIETIAADAAAKAALEASFPGLTAHPAYEQFKGMSLRQLQPLAAGQITDEQLAKAGTDLAAIK